jgi:membrane associated rhomboid family serine protease
MIEYSEKKYMPWFTILFTVLLVGVYFFLAFLSKSFIINLEHIEKWGAPYATQIYLGHVYGVVTNNLIHISGLHLIANLLGLWLFGAYIERRVGSLKMAVFGLASSILGSIAQLNFSNDAGLGISAAIFGFYSYILVTSYRDEHYKESRKRTLIFGIVLFFLLLVFTFTNEFYNDIIAVHAKIMGAIWGALMAISQRGNKISKKTAILLFIPFSFIAVTLVYAPWSSQWQSAKGIYFHENKAYDKAKEHYKKALEIDPNNELAKENKTSITIDSISNLAYHAHLNGDYTKARRYYFQILNLRKNDRWALENLKELP